MSVKVKICGLTSTEEVQMLISEKAEYGGVVLFYEKSKRNCNPEQAKKIVLALQRGGIKSIAVTVAPTLQQTKRIADMGFDYIQIHGELKEEVLRKGSLPIIRAFNVTNMEEQISIRNEKRIVGWLFDGVTSGEGKCFDWSILSNMERNGKMVFLAGGLTAENVSEAVKEVKPDVVDVSSGVEFENPDEIIRRGFRKNPEKVKQFIRNAKRYQ